MMLQVSIPHLSILLHCFIWRCLMTKVQCSNSIDKISYNITDKAVPRIVNGYNCPIEAHPYMVSIRFTQSFIHYCGGTLISEFWILTAAHCCIKDYQYGFFTAYAGLSVISRKTFQKRLIARNYVHETQKEHDIGLMTLNTPISQTHSIRYVHLANRLHPQQPIEKLCKKCIAIGWGVQYPMNEKDKPVSHPIPPHNHHLQCVDLTVITHEECERRYETYIPEEFVCTYVPGKDACQGDSGGPLMCNEVQYGIVSFGKGCAFKNYPGVFVRVDMYEDFIRNIITRSGELSIYKCANFFTYLLDLMVILFCK